MMKALLVFLITFAGSAGLAATEIKCKSTYRFPYSVTIHSLSSKMKFVTIKKKNKVVYHNKVKFQDHGKQKEFVSGRQFAMSISTKSSLGNMSAMVQEEGNAKWIADGRMSCKIL